MVGPQTRARNLTATRRSRVSVHRHATQPADTGLPSRTTSVVLRTTFRPLLHTPLKSEVPLIVGRHVHPGSEDEFRAWDRRIRAAAGSYAGFLGFEVQPPNPSYPGEWITVHSFEMVTQFNVRLDFDQRATLIAEGADPIDGAARIQQVAGIRATPQPVPVLLCCPVARRSGATAPDRHSRCPVP